MHTSVSGRSWYGGGHDHGSVAPSHNNKSTQASPAQARPGGLRWCTRFLRFGVVRPRDIKYRVHMCPSLDDPLLFRLNTDVWEYM